MYFKDQSFSLSIGCVNIQPHLDSIEMCFFFNSKQRVENAMFLTAHPVVIENLNWVLDRLNLQFGRRNSKLGRYTSVGDIRFA